MSIDRQESEGFEATSTTPTPDDLSNVDRGDDRPSLDRWSPIESRIGWPGRLFKRSLRRLMRFSLATQADFNERLIAKTDALALQLSVGDAENSQSIASLETRLRTRIEALERSFEETVEPRLDRLEERARLTDKDWREAASDLDNRLDSTLQRVEAIEHHSIAFQSDVTGDFRNVRVTATTQGRQIDDIAGQLLAHVHSLPELEARLRATLEAQPTPREVLSAEIASIHQLHADHIAICEETASTREQLTTAQNELNVLREGVDGLTKTQQRQAASEARLDEVTQDLGTRTNTIGSTLDEITAEIRTRAETFERTLGAVQKGGVERLEVLNIRLENIESAVAGAHERVATSQESEAAARGVIADALVSITSEARGRL
ncbi:MAG: hypothetical protein GY910_21695, partial [bacterium]|nr:hypothetical protein [bacterium]